MRRAVAVILLVFAPAAAGAQVSIDSIRALNRAGLWQNAGLLARSAIASAKTVNDRCAYRESAVYSLTRLGMLEAAVSELKTFDAECSESRVARDDASAIAQLRADHAAAVQAITPDSVRRLSEAHRWMAAIALADRGIAASPRMESSCALMVELLDASAHTGNYEGTARGFEKFDARCASSPVARMRSADIARIRADITLPPLPKSGFDFSAVDRFFDLADVLSRDAEPTDAQWRAFFITPGYRFHTMDEFRELMPLAFRPSLAAKRDSLSRANRGAAGFIGYLLDVNAHRTDLKRWRDTVPLRAIAEHGAARTLAFMPKGYTPTIPLVAFGVFGACGFSVGTPGVVLDNLYAMRSDLELFLGHEFHHSFDAGISRIGPEFTDGPDIPLYNSLVWLRNEGIADLIDKPYPLHHTDTLYQRQYNALYARTPATLRAIDSLLARVGSDTALLRATGYRVRSMLPSSGHASGAYIARTVYETFGVDSLTPALYNPFALLRTYAAVEATRGNSAPFSAATLALLNDIERKHLAASGAR